MFAPIDFRFFCRFTCCLALVTLSAWNGRSYAESTTQTLRAESASTTTTSPAVLQWLEQMEKRFKDLKTIRAEFDQVREQDWFDDDTRSQGLLQIMLPDKLRCDYNLPDPTTILFTGRNFYQYTPKLNQVEKFVYTSEEKARRQLKSLLLSFGLSSQEVLDNYQVTEDPKSFAKVENSVTLKFVPKESEIAKIYKEIVVCLDKKRLLPKHVRFSEVGGDTTTLTIRRILDNDAVEAQVFEANFPKNAEIIEYQQ